jgi:quinoprotein glucose dehydrogenase
VRFVHLSAALLSVAALICCSPASAPSRRPRSPADHDWPAYGGGPDGLRASPLAQVNRQTVQRLQVAWTYDAREAGGLETQPIVVDGVLYGNTPTHKAIALDASTGQLIWRFDSGLDSAGANRGVTYWRGGDDERIFAAVDQYLYALDARTGHPIPGFGEHGRIDLRKDLDRDPAALSLRLTSPGIVFRDLLIIGGRASESQGAAPGHVRAYDVRTGQLRWIFHTIPRPEEVGYDTWPSNAWTYSGGTNNWAGMALDERRGIVYVPTGSAAADFYGADRLGNDLFANSLIALDAATGRRIWHFQIVHHDLWDRDLPSPPTLVTVRSEGRSVDAVVQTTKQGFVFLFDRTTGQSLFPIEERPFPGSTVTGEQAAVTQPIPTRPLPFARQQLTAEMLTTRTPQAHQAALDAFGRMRSAGQFVPLSVDRDTIVFPGFDGGAEWGGAAVDPATGVLYVNATEMAWTGSLTSTTGSATGHGAYLAHCAECHGDDMAGAPPQIPALIGLRERRTPERVKTIVQQGIGRMPSFSNLSDEETAALIEYVLSGQDKEIGASASTPTGFLDRARTLVNQLLGRPTRPASAAGAPPRYRFTGYKKFLDPQGFPAIQPPWGTLNAIDLNTGDSLWKVPLGTYPALAEAGLTDTGSENYGGPLVTAGGLLFIGATSYDRQFRAFDKDTGRLLWSATLPFAGNATPITYDIDGRQFIVIAAGGGKADGVPSGGVYVAFALPK